MTEPAYYGPLTFTGSVGRSSLETLLHVPNHGEQLGILVVRNLVVISAISGRKSPVPAVHTDDIMKPANGNFTALSITRLITQSNRVAAGGPQGEEYPEQIDREKIDVLGSFDPHCTFGETVIGRDKRVDFQLATLNILTRGSSATEIPVTISAPIWDAETIVR